MSATTDLASDIRINGADRGTFQPKLLRAMMDDGLTQEQAIRAYDFADEHGHADGCAFIVDWAAELVWIYTGKR